jgi:hypothetical protein
MKILFAACLLLLVVSPVSRAQISDCKNPYGSLLVTPQERPSIMGTIRAVKLISIGYVAMEQVMDLFGTLAQTSPVMTIVRAPVLWTETATAHLMWILMT